MLLLPNQKAGYRRNFSFLLACSPCIPGNERHFCKLPNQFSISFSNQVCKSPISGEGCGKPEITSGPSADKTEVHSIFNEGDAVPQSSAYVLCHLLSSVVYLCLKILGHQICPFQIILQSLKFMLRIQQILLQLQGKVLQLDFPTIQKLQIVLQQI